MYHELSANQATALEQNSCPKCGAKDAMAKEWTRNGLTVKCNSCKETVNRPRGRAVAGTTAASGGRKQKAPPSNETPEQKQLRELEEAAAEAKADQAAREQEAKEQQEEKEQYEREKREMMEAMERMVKKAVQDKAPSVVQVQHKKEGEPLVTTEVQNPHKLLPEVLRRVNAGIRNFLFVGPSGSGKTTLGSQVAKALNLPDYLQPWSGGITEGTIFGRITPNGDYLPSISVTAFEQASVLIWDELDKGDPNVSSCAQAMIEQGRIHLGMRQANPILQRHAMSLLLANGNTWGNGADMMYCGSNQLDAALKDRFACGIFWVDYDTDLEAALVPEQPYRDIFWQLRAKHQEHRLRRIWGTRGLIRGATLLRDGYTVNEVFTALTVGYTPDELSKIGVAA